MNKTVKFIARTAIMIALVTLLQWLGQVIGKAVPVIGPTLITGSFVNAILVLSVIFCGVWGGVIVGCLTPVMALVIGQMGFPVLIPFIALGNAVLCVVLFLIMKLFKVENDTILSKRTIALGVGIAGGAVIKFLYMYLILALLILPLLGIPPKAQTLLQANFGVMQLITALLGGVIAVGVFLPLRKAVKPL
ncbi:MAG: ECF transporter S component [Clostridia bacterium]